MLAEGDVPSHVRRVQISVTEDLAEFLLIWYGKISVTTPVGTKLGDLVPLTRN